MKAFILAFSLVTLIAGCRPPDQEPKTSSEIIKEQGGGGIDESNRTTNAGTAPGGANSKVTPDK
jgi:hypothetical protein